MQALVTVHLQDAIKQALTLKELMQFSSFLLNFASANHFTFKQGQLILQSFSNYLVFIELFDYVLTENTVVDIEIHKSAFFMLIMPEGHSVFVDNEGHTVSETAGNCSTLSYISAGCYQRKMLAGKHSLLLFTFREEWFAKLTAKIEAFAELFSSYKENAPYFVLPHCAIAKRIYSYTAGLDLENTAALKVDKKVLGLIDFAIDSYTTRLLNKQYDYNTVKNARHGKFIQFIKENFTDAVVDHHDQLADKLNVSKVVLKRMALEAFGKPLRKQVIEYRMLHSLKLLTLTDKPIQEIAQTVGYTDQRYFSTCFKKYFNIKPHEVRIR